MHDEPSIVDYESNAPSSRMPAVPDFTPDERYIIALYESDSQTGGWVVWLIHAAMVALFAYGLYDSNDALVITAFGVVILWRVYESSHQPRFFSATRSVLRKYAERVRQLSDRLSGRG